MEKEDEITVEDKQGKTFTQEQVNAIVGKRLAEQKAAAESDLVKREKELEEREIKLKALEILSKKQLPSELADILKYSDDDSLNKAIEVVEKMNTQRGKTNYIPVGSSGKTDHLRGAFFEK